MKKLFDYFGLILLAIFLFSTHAKLFYWLQPSFAKGQMIDFSWQIWDEHTIQSMIYGALFGLMTVYIIARRKESPLYKYFIIAIALLDGLVVFYLYEGDIEPFFKMAFASIHYAIYTVFIILMFGFAGKQKITNGANIKMYLDKKHISVAKAIKKDTMEVAGLSIDEGVITLLQQGLKQSEICKQLGLKPYQVTRIKQKYKSNSVDN